MRNRSLTWDEFLAYLRPVVPGTPNLTVDTIIDELGMPQRLAIWRWLEGALGRPTELGIIRGYRTVGEAWAWLAAEVARGDELRPSTRIVSASETTRIRLRPLADADIPLLYEASMSPSANIRWRYRGATLSPQEFMEGLHQNVRAQLVVEMKETGDPTGLVVAYEHYGAGGHCKVGFVRFGDHAPNDWGAVYEGLVCFLSYLFTSYPYKKIYAEVPTYNMALVEGVVGDFMTQEGCLEGYLFADGDECSLHVLSMSRDQWRRLHALWS